MLLCKFKALLLMTGLNLFLQRVSHKTTEIYAGQNYMHKNSWPGLGYIYIYSKVVTRIIGVVLQLPSHESQSGRGGTLFKGQGCTDMCWDPPHVLCRLPVRGNQMETYQAFPNEN